MSGLLFTSFGASGAVATKTEAPIEGLSALEMFPEIDSKAEIWPIIVQSLLLAGETRLLLDLLKTKDPNVVRLLHHFSELTQARRSKADDQDKLVSDPEAEIARMQISIGTAEIQQDIVKLEQKRRIGPGSVFPRTRLKYEKQIADLKSKLQERILEMGGDEGVLTLYPIHDEGEIKFLRERIVRLRTTPVAHLTEEVKRSLYDNIQRETVYIEKLNVELETDSFWTQTARRAGMQWLPRVAGFLLTLDVVARIGILANGRNPNLLAGRLYVPR